MKNIELTNGKEGFGFGGLHQNTGLGPWKGHQPGVCHQQASQVPKEKGLGTRGLGDRGEM